MGRLLNKNMKEINIVWNKVTVHSRFWAIILFIGVLPSLAFYAGIKVDNLINTQQQLAQLSEQTLFQSEHGMCRVSDCTIQSAVEGTKIVSGANLSPAIKVVSPQEGDHVNPKSSVKVIWNVAPGSSVTNVSVLLLDSTGHAASRVVTAPVSAGFANIEIPAKVSKTPYTVLIQSATRLTSGQDVPFAYSGEFYL